MPWKTSKPREPLDEAALYEYAVGALGRRMRTVAELRRQMRTRVEKGETGEARIEAVVERLKAQRYLDDQAFAADYTRLRQEGAKFGRRRVQQDLQRKGVDGELVTTTIETAYENVDEEALARQFLERKRMRKPENEKESARVVRRLVSGGFSIGTAYKILKNWGVGEAVLAAVEGIDLHEAERAGDD
jgi:regulatory protein